MSKLKKIVHKYLFQLGIRRYSSKQKRVMGVINKKYKYKKNKNKSDDSLIFFTTHKCASNYIKELLNFIEFNSEYSTFDYGKLVGGLADELKIKGQVEGFLNLNYKKLFFSKGEIYGPQRMPLNFTGLEKYKSIFFLRDPRDVLISSYYSFGYSHPEPSSVNLKKIHLTKRNHIQNTTIDAYVLDQAKSWILPMYSEYNRLYLSCQNSLFLSYDLFINDTEKFLVNIFNFLNIEINDSEISEFAKKASPIVENVSIQNHKRSGRSRQWEYELSEEVQKKLIVLLDPILKDWDFEH